LFVSSTRSASVGAARVKKMKARDDLLEQLKKESVEKLAKYCQGPEYPTYLRKIIVQGLIKIEESTVEIQARAEDKVLVSRVVS
jgi:vacuolar-type H+-ATPase subunit E/Vma4